MRNRSRLIARVALFSALIYVLSWATSYLPNVNFIFFIVFTAGFVWGAAAGSLVGLIGMGLWTLLNPYGPADIAVSTAQVLGASAGGPIGAIFRRTAWRDAKRLSLTFRLVLAAAACTVAFYVLVNTVDAWVYQPFWPRFLVGLGWMLISLVSNVLIFPLLFGVTRLLYERECSGQS
jgi:uncharacterized membrane protein